MNDLDRIDGYILEVLGRNARISNVDLARRVGLSPPACLRRVQQLERVGIITGYHARLNLQALGRGFVAYIHVGLSTQNKAVQEAFERAIIAAPEVVECHNTTGAFEYLLRVEVSDLAAFKTFHTETLGALAHVASITSSVVMDSPKDR